MTASPYRPMWRRVVEASSWIEGPMKAAHHRGGEDAPQQKPAAVGSTLWSFEVVQQAAPKQG